MVKHLLARGLSSIRLRIVSAAILVVGLTLFGGAEIAQNIFRTSINNNLNDAALSLAAELGSLAQSGKLPRTLNLPNQDTAFAQIIDSNSNVIASSANIAGEPPLEPPLSHTGSSSSQTKTIDSPIGQDGHFGLVGTSVKLKSQTLSIFIAYSLSTANLATREFTNTIDVSIILILALMALVMWIIIGRALRPIDLIQSEVSDITSMDLHRRVRVPKSQDEIARLARTMNSLLERLEASAQQQRNFIADASHELRSPLSAIRTQLEVGIARGPGTDWEMTAVDVLVEEARIEQLVSNLLVLARLDNHNEEEVTIPVDLTVIVESYLSTIVKRENVRFVVDLNGPALIGLRPQMARIMISNLIENAQRYARSIVKIFVSPGANSDVHLSVSDDGPGIPREDRDRAFGRFVRLDEARTADDGGAGLGLAIVKQIVHEAGGKVGFEDVADGTRVNVRLPLMMSNPGVATK